MNTAFLTWTTKLHRWSSYLLFIPISFWMVGGAFMTLTSIEEVRGSHTHVAEDRVYLSGSELAAIGAHLQGQEIKSVGPRSLLGRKYYEVSLRSGKALYRADTLERLWPLEPEFVASVALSGYSPDVEVESVRLLEIDAPIEYRGELPAWQVILSDGAALYLDGKTARIVARRSDLWRAFDFFWMLHTFDFEGRDNFNNLLVRSAAVAGLVFLITGLVLTGHRANRALRHKRRKRKHKLN